MKFKTNKSTAMAKQLFTKLGSKSKTIAIVMALCAFANANAQRLKKQTAYFPGNDINTILNSTEDDETQFYLYNVGLKKFMMPGGPWGTSVDLGPTGLPLQIKKDKTLPEDLEGYRIYTKGINTEIVENLGSVLSITYGALYIDRTPRPWPNVDRPRIMLTKVEGTGNNKHMYYLSAYKNGIYSVKDGKPYDEINYPTDITWTYSGKMYVVASKNPTYHNTHIDYKEDYNEVKSMSDSLALWKLVTLKDLKHIIKDTYNVTEEPANISYLMKDPWILRTKKRSQNWDMNPESAFFNEASILYHEDKGMLSHSELQGKTGKMSQTVTVNHPGWFIISCQGFSYKNRNSDLKAVLFAQDDKGTKVYSSQKAELYTVSSLNGMNDYYKRGQKFLDGEYENNNVMIYLDGEKNDKSFRRTITFGVETTGDNVNESDVVAFDNFKLQYAGVNTLVLDEDLSERDYIVKQVDKYIAKTLVMQRAFKENQWNSIIFPFNLTGEQVELAFGKNAKVSKFKGSSAVKETPSLIEFESVALGDEHKYNTVIEAGKLYLIYPAKTLRHIEEEAEYPVALSNGQKQNFYVKGTYFIIPNVGLITAPSKDNIEEPYKDSPFGNNSLRYRGTYVNHTDDIIPANSYVLNKDGYWYLTSKPHNVKGFRCWIEAKDPTTSAKRLNISIDGEILNGTNDTVTGIEEFGLSNKITPNSKVYDVYGRVIGNTVEDLNNGFKGVYIINGKKYVK